MISVVHFKVMLFTCPKFANQFFENFKIPNGTCPLFPLGPSKFVCKTCANNQLLKHCVIDGFPEHRHMVSDGTKPFWQVRHHLSIEEDLI